MKPCIKMLKCHKKSDILKVAKRSIFASLSELTCTKEVAASFFFNVIDNIELISGCHKAIE